MLALSLCACADRVAADACTEPALCNEQLALSGGGRLRIFRSQAIAPNPEIRRAVVVVHGNRRDADRYFERLVVATRGEGRLDDTILLAPSFKTQEDGPARGEHYWSSSGWKVGNRSRDPARISSFSLMDELVARLCPRFGTAFPDLEAVVIIGHSAGGQFVNRYAAGGKGCPDDSVEVRYVVMNPSSYLYLDASRPSGSDGAFEAPHSACDGYDEYKYGLGDLNRYMKRTGPGDIRENLFQRRVFYLAGEEDTRAGKSLDQSCRGMLQGAHRLSRHRNYRRHAARFPTWTGSTFETVPGIGHSGGAMLASEAARRAVFR